MKLLNDFTYNINKIELIKLIRKVVADMAPLGSMGLGLKEAKDWIEAYLSRERMESPASTSFSPPKDSIYAVVGQSLASVVISFARAFPGAVLTGSQHFGNANSNSDWDFFILDTQGNRLKLEDSGFLPDSETDYTDSNTSAVLVKEIDYCRFIHVQLVRNVDIKLAAQDKLDNLPHLFKQNFLEASNKSTKRNIWEWAFQLVGGKN